MIFFYFFENRYWSINNIDFIDFWRVSCRSPPVTKNNLTNTWHILANFFFVWHRLPPHWCASMSFFKIRYRSIDIVIIVYRFSAFFCVWPVTKNNLTNTWYILANFFFVWHPLPPHWCTSMSFFQNSIPINRYRDYWLSIFPFFWKSVEYVSNRHVAL